MHFRGEVRKLLLLNLILAIAVKKQVHDFSKEISDVDIGHQGQQHDPMLGIARTPDKIPGLCTGKSGVLLIEQGDRQAAIGTLFFGYIVNHLIYAKLNNLQPWIHLRPKSPCHDKVIHGTQATTFEILAGVKEKQLRGTGLDSCKHNASYPGEILVKEDQLYFKNLTIRGNGVWGMYFESFGFPPKDISCQEKPLVRLKRSSINPGMHFCAPWSVHAWPHQSQPIGLRPEGMNVTVLQWFSSMRQRGAKIVREHYKPLPWIQDQVNAANPTSTGACLSMHIRMTDKGHGRVKMPLELFQDYAEVYAKGSGGKPIYVATDDATVLSTIKSQWNIQSLQYQQDVIRMNGGEAAIFQIFYNETHRTNKEGLVDIYALAKCDFFIHGYSAIAEAVFFINLGLHNRSINVDVPKEELVTVEAFEDQVAHHYSDRRGRE